VSLPTSFFFKIILAIQAMEYEIPYEF